MHKSSYILIVCLFVCSDLYSQTNKALFVAIDQYPANSGWSEIHATNDSKLVLPMLKRYGYKEANITVLLNEEATKANVVNALSAMCSKAKAGDYLYLHFSCHGQQMLDDNGDEPDGLDEALIPYDARRRYVKGIYEGESHLRDDLLGIFLNKIRAKIGATGNVTVVLDACHSGTADRDGNDEGYARGTSYVFAPDGYQTQLFDSEKISLHLQKDKHLAPITVFSACKPDEINYEYKSEADSTYYGSLSYALCKVLKTDGERTNTEFCKLLNDEIETMFVGRRRKQTPYFESTDDSQIFKISR